MMMGMGGCMAFWRWVLHCNVCRQDRRRARALACCAGGFAARTAWRTQECMYGMPQAHPFQPVPQQCGLIRMPQDKFFHTAAAAVTCTGHCRRDRLCCADMEGPAQAHMELITAAHKLFRSKVGPASGPSQSGSLHGICGYGCHPCMHPT